MLRRRRLRDREPAVDARIEYVPLDDLGDRPHIMIDGSARPGTILNLSHWPHSSTAPDLRRDLSAQIVLQALATGSITGAAASAATIDHYDEDGVVALGFAVVDGLAEHYASLLVDAARVGDFGVVRDRRAALVAFALATIGDPTRSPFEEVRAAGRKKGGHLEACGHGARNAIGMLADLARDPLAFESLWRDEAAAYDAAVAGLKSWATIEELPEQDLAIVTLEPESAASSGAGWIGSVMHHGAVNSATGRLRVATIAGDRMEVRFRYESWVRMTTYRPRPRVNLSGLASKLERLERGGAKWHFDGANATRPVLRVLGDGRSGLEPQMFIEAVVAELDLLDGGPPAFDPYK
jgi:hypothetical protein